MGYGALLFSASPLSGTLFRLVPGFSVFFSGLYLWEPQENGVTPIPSEKVCFGLCFPHRAALTNGSLISVILFWGYIQCELESHTSIVSGLSHEPSSSSFVSFVMQFPLVLSFH